MCERKISFLKGFTVDKTIISLLGLKKTETVHIHTRRTITHVHINICGFIHMQTHIYSTQHKTTFSPQKFKQMPKCGGRFCWALSALCKCVGHLWKKCLLVIIFLQKYCASYTQQRTTWQKSCRSDAHTLSHRLDSLHSRLALPLVIPFARHHVCASQLLNTKLPGKI